MNIPASPAELTEVPAKRAVRLHNEQCVYCGEALDKVSRTKEHVIGRRFVPKGKLKVSWNLIVWSCHPCNHAKSILEDDISAITMQPDAWGRYVSEDHRLSDEAARKGLKSISSRTRRPVANSAETINVKGNFGSAMSFTMALTAPPQLNMERVWVLARLHLMGLFYWLTYRPEHKQGGYFLGSYRPVLEAMQGDWGNDTHMAFMRLTNDWHLRLISDSAIADGFFKFVIRRHPEAVCWSWALEWNQNLRLVGFWGQDELVDELVAQLPDHHGQPGLGDTNSGFALRTEKRISADDDILFAWSADGSASGKPPA